MDTTGATIDVDVSHRHYHPVAQELQPGEIVHNRDIGVFSCRRRQCSRLCVPRSAFVEPLGPKREDYYEQRLLEGLPWFCVDGPSKRQADDDAPTWLFDCHPCEDLPDNFRFATRDRQVLDDGFNETSFEQLCLRFERGLTEHMCGCCSSSQDAKCSTCLHAIGFHVCAKTGRPSWKAGTLHNGKLDVEAYLWALIRRNVPMDVVQQRLADLISEQSLAPEDEEKWLRQASEMRKTLHATNPYAGAASTHGSTSSGTNAALTIEELKAMLKEREDNMQKQVVSDN